MFHDRQTALSNQIFSNPVAWRRTLLANLSSCKPRTVRGGDNAISCVVDHGIVKVAMAENADHLARINFRKSNCLKYM